MSHAHERAETKWAPGFTSAATAAGIKGDGRADLGMLVAQDAVRWAGTFTKNAAAAACVEWNRRLLGDRVRAIVCNSGNANACTGKRGQDAVVTTAQSAAAALGCSSREVLVASTGPIGVQLPVGLITDALPGLVGASLTQEVMDFSKAILTTDTRTKIAIARAGDATIVGVAKGAAMLAPNMATMLAFLTTDAGVPELQSHLNGAVKQSFDRLCVDACESTNDSVFLMTSEAVACTGSDFAAALQEVCWSLAEQMVSDAEGASRVIRIEMSGAKDGDHAAQLGRAIASSALWRSAAFGADPNWGRILSALGATDRDLSLEDITISLGDVRVFDGGEPTAELEAARAAMETDAFTVTCSVGAGTGSATILTTDLTPDYVTLNAHGTT